MVLESILSMRIMRSKPWDAFFLAIFYASVGSFLAYLVFPSEISLVMVLFTTMAAIPSLVSLLKVEEREQIVFGKPFIKTHMDVLAIFFFMFMGMLAFFIALSTIVPEDVFVNVFEKQIDTIKAISGVTSSAVSANVLEMVLINNFKVLFFVVIFSFIYGAGAIFILTWNASVLGTAIGNAIRQQIANLGGSLSSYFQAVPLALGAYMIHGTLEVIAYFLGAIAGGIISAAVVRHDYRSQKFKEVIVDSVDMIILASITLIIAGIVEVLI
jgi:hypothetical protein